MTELSKFQQELLDTANQKYHEASLEFGGTYTTYSLNDALMAIWDFVGDLNPEWIY